MFKRILVGLDLVEREEAKRIIDIAVRLAQTDQSELRLVSVRYMLEGSLPYLPKDYFVEEERQARKELQDLAAETSIPAERVSVSSPIGTIYDEILGEAKAYDADLIIVGAHRPRMTAYLLGSNAARVVRHAECSVMVVR